MGVEIERKFLVDGDGWREGVSRSVPMRQGYLAGPPGARCSVRVRVAGSEAFLNIKSLAQGIVRDEYEYALPPGDAARMLESLAGDVVAKLRHHVVVDGCLFEVDEFEGANAGLVVAEIELAMRRSRDRRGSAARSAISSATTIRTSRSARMRDGPVTSATPTTRR